MNFGGFLQTLGTQELSFCLRAAKPCGPVLRFKSHPQQIIWLEEGPQGWTHVGFSGPPQPLWEGWGGPEQPRDQQEPPATIPLAPHS